MRVSKEMETSSLPFIANSFFLPTLPRFSAVFPRPNSSQRRHGCHGPCHPRIQRKLRFQCADDFVAAQAPIPIRITDSKPGLRVLAMAWNDKMGSQVSLDRSDMCHPWDQTNPGNPSSPLRELTGCHRRSVSRGLLQNAGHLLDTGNGLVCYRASGTATRQESVSGFRTVETANPASAGIQEDCLTKSALLASFGTFTRHLRVLVSATGHGHGHIVVSCCPSGHGSQMQWLEAQRALSIALRDMWSRHLVQSVVAVGAAGSSTDIVYILET